jgi:hypothetical protein
MFGVVAAFMDVGNKKLRFEIRVNTGHLGEE